MLQLQLPKQQVQQLTITEPVNHSDTASADTDSISMADSEESAHPLAPTLFLGNQESPLAEENNSLHSFYHGQDFSHMFIEPTIINVQLENDDEKGIEVIASNVVSGNSTVYISYIWVHCI